MCLRLFACLREREREREREKEREQERERERERVAHVSGKCTCLRLFALVFVCVGDIFVVLCTFSIVFFWKVLRCERVVCLSRILVLLVLLACKWLATRFFRIQHASDKVIWLSFVIVIWLSFGLYLP